MRAGFGGLPSGRPHLVFSPSLRVNEATATLFCQRCHLLDEKGCEKKVLESLQMLSRFLFTFQRKMSFSLGLKKCSDIR